MTAQEFCYWLKGYLELSEVDLNKVDFATTLSREQVKCINEHLGYVFAPKITVSPRPISQTGGGSSGVDLSQFVKESSGPFSGAIC